MFSLTPRRTIMASTGLLASLASSLALAHVGADGAQHIHGADALNSFVNGALHPVTGLDHLAAMIGVGLWSAIGLKGAAGGPTAPRMIALWKAPAAFAGALLCGALASLGGLSLPGVEPMIAASVLILGLLVAMSARWPAGAAMSLVATFALFHGVAHGQELGGHASAALGGMVLSTALLHAVGMVAGLGLRLEQHPARRWVSRAAGAGVALLGLNMLAPVMMAAATR